MVRRGRHTSILVGGRRGEHMYRDLRKWPMLFLLAAARHADLSGACRDRSRNKVSDGRALR